MDGESRISSPSNSSSSSSTTKGGQDKFVLRKRTWDSKVARALCETHGESRSFKVGCIMCRCLGE